ncbi:MAG: glycosyltransferase family 2 protein [Deltaproteobacteria bacterium]|nr:glycosyltransferase family 2 protein [Deltaproteobacteria bacterium]
MSELDKTSAAATSAEKVSACIITLNEEDRLGPCLKSLSWCDEIVVVDSHSSDGTRELATSFGARVIERDWPGHVDQKEFAIREARHDWVLCLDADEQLSDELKAEILALRDAGFPNAPGWSMPRLATYLGQPMHHGGWYPDRKIRLFDRRRGHWGGSNPHDHVQLQGSAEALAGDLLHDPYRNFSEHLRILDSYSSIGAQELAKKNVRAKVSDIIFRPAIRFTKFYILKSGWREGWRGLLLAYLSAYGCRLKYAKLLIAQRIENSDEAR